LFYLIDGYNLLHRVGLLSGRTVGAQLQWARRRLLEKLRDHYREEAYRVTVVFDARNAPDLPEGDTNFHGIEVLFAREESADDLIEAMIRETDRPSQLTVVSDDNRLREAARRRKCRIRDCVSYFASLDDDRQAPTIAEPQEATKPEQKDPGETERWLKEFGEVDDGWEY